MKERAVWPNIVLMLGTVTIGCAPEADGGATRAPPPASPPAATVRVLCDADATLRSYATVPSPAPVRRIIFGDDETLVNTDSGLFRLTGMQWHQIRENGRDFALLSDTLVQLQGGELQLLHYRPPQPPEPTGSFAVHGNESSIAVAAGSVFLHAATNENNYLVTRWSLRNGTITDYLLPVERNFHDLFLNDFAGLLDDASRIRGFDSWLALVPYTKSPVRLLDLKRGRRYHIRTVEAMRGRVTVKAHEVLGEEREQDCSMCTVHITRREKVYPRIEAIHADAAFADGGLWILGHTAPASEEARLYHFPIEEDGPIDGTAWAVPGLGAAPKSLWVRSDQLLIATKTALHWFSNPVRGGFVCDEPAA